MINLRPFKGIRPKKEFCSSIVSPPYDVLSFNEVKEIIKKNPLSFLRISRSDGDFLDDIDPYSDEVYQKAKNNYMDFKNQKYLKKDDSECYYLYKQSFGDYIQTGIIAVVSIEDYLNGLIKKHENTRKDKENDRIRHIQSVNAQTGFVFLTYKNNSSISLNEIVKDVEKTIPENSFETEDGITHSFWIINDKNKTDKITEQFKNIPYLYIADGHHRAAASAEVYKKDKGLLTEEKKYFLSIIYPHDDLNVLSYNRVIKNLNNHTIQDFFIKIENNFIVKKVESNDEKGGYRPIKKGNIGMYLDKQWYELSLKDSINIENDPICKLDVSILQNYILFPILEIFDPRTDKRIDFIGGKDMVDLKKFSVAFSLYPTSIEELMEVADQNKLMPPKSTWFEPKPRSGFVVHELD